MLRPEVQSHLPLYKYIGTGAGGVLGFIVGNLPGMAMGGWAGNRLGAIRDAKGAPPVPLLFGSLASR